MRTVVLAFAISALSAAYWIGMIIWLSLPLFGWVGDWTEASEPDPRPTMGRALALLAVLLAGWAVIAALWDRLTRR